MDLVIHHVFQALVIGGAKEHLGVQLPPSEAIVEHLVPPQMVIVVSQKVRDLLHVDSVVKRSRISNFTLVC